MLYFKFNIIFVILYILMAPCIIRILQKKNSRHNNVGSVLCKIWLLDPMTNRHKCHIYHILATWWLQNVVTVWRQKGLKNDHNYIYVTMNSHPLHVTWHRRSQRYNVTPQWRCRDIRNSNMMNIALINF